MPQPAWSDRELRGDPHAAADKARRVREMFTAVAPSYDLNNRVHSLGQDQAWRRAAVRAADLRPGDVVLDVACGTGDLALAFARARPVRPARVVGIDFTYAMLPLAVKKAAPLAALTSPECPALAATPGCDAGPTRDVTDPSPRHARSFDSPPVAFANGDALRLPLPDACVDVVSISFGIRNVTDPAAAVREFHRVLRPGGRLLILEFSTPTFAPLRAVYLFYFHHVLPRTASLIARDRSGAYNYLPRSVNTFLGREQLVALMTDAGFDGVRPRPLTFGIAVLYKGVKP